MDMICKKHPIDIGIWNYSHYFMEPLLRHTVLRGAESFVAVVEVFLYQHYSHSWCKFRALICFPRSHTFVCMSCYNHISISADFYLRT